MSRSCSWNPLNGTDRAEGREAQGSFVAIIFSLTTPVITARRPQFCAAEAKRLVHRPWCRVSSSLFLRSSSLHY